MKNRYYYRYLTQIIVKCRKEYAHLNDIIINNITDHDTKNNLRVHVILGAGECTEIKIPERVRVGHIAELTRVGWGGGVISPGEKSGLTNMMFSKTSHYKNLCSLDVLGVSEEHVRQDKVVHYEFKNNLAKVLMAGMKRIYTRKRNILHLMQISLEVWLN